MREGQEPRRCWCLEVVFGDDGGWCGRDGVEGAEGAVLARRGEGGGD